MKILLRQNCLSNIRQKKTLKQSRSREESQKEATVEQKKCQKILTEKSVQNLKEDAQDAKKLSKEKTLAQESGMFMTQELYLKLLKLKRNFVLVIAVSFA